MSSLHERPNSDDGSTAPSWLDATKLAGAGPRFLAFFLDAVILFFSLPLWILALGLAAQAVMPDAYAGLLAIAVGFLGYFAVSYLFGRTPGMRLMNLRLVRASNRTDPGTTRAMLRALLVGLPFVSLLALMVAGFSESSDAGSETADTVLITSAAIIFVAGSAARLTQLIDARRQSLIDHSAGTLVIADRQDTA